MKITTIIALLTLVISAKLFALEEQEITFYTLPAISTQWVDKPNTDHRLISHISNKYNVEPDKVQEIVKTATIKSDTSFPTKLDILAIIAIESRFNQYAKAKTSSAKGLMQILYKPTSYDIETNIDDGARLLKDYSYMLPKDAAIQAYNVGIGAYLSGVRNKDYLNKFKQARRNMEIHEV
jgi:hypothetical protein